MTAFRPTDESARDIGAAAPVLEALDGAEMGIFVLDSEFTVRWMNRTMAEYFGLDRASVLGEDKATLIDSRIRSIFAEPERFADTVRSTYEDNSYIEEFECHVLPGENRTERWLRHQSRPIERGDLAGGRVEHYTDITEQKARERELERQNERLEKFASLVSHDLRNPLLVADGRLELAQASGDREQVTEAREAIERCQALIDDLLTLAREGDALGDTERVDLAALVDTCWATVETGTATLTVDVPGAILADRSRLRQVLENLVRNAVEHGATNTASSTRQEAAERGSTTDRTASEDRDGDTVPLEITVGALDDGFYVEDDGVGVTPSMREQVFEPAFSTAEGGTGFGLAIVEEIVAAHGWTIRLTESESGGTRFEITGVERPDGSASTD